jgi:ABC-type antimicrobial peptide transport system permease subunit
MICESDTVALRQPCISHLYFQPVTMIYNLIHLTWRHLLRQRSSTGMHLVGLTLGITVCLLIALFIRYELSYDAFHPQTKSTYRVVSDWTQNGNLTRHASTPFPLAAAIRTGVSGVEHVSFIHPVNATTVEVTPDKRFIIDHIVAVEREFPDIIGVEVLRGDLRQTLSQPYRAAITESTAQKLFGTEDPMGKTFKLKMREEFEFIIASVIRDLPANTHFEISLMVSHSYQENFLKANRDGWTYISGTETFVTLSQSADPNALVGQLNNLADQHINLNSGSGFRSSFSLQPMEDIHFDTGVSDGHAISVTWLWFFGAIGLAVLVLACINFMNLSTAQALTRAKEVGIRKSIGASRWSLMSQFLAEAWTLTFAAGIISVTLTQMLLPSVNAMLGKGIEFNLLESPGMLTVLLFGLTITGLLAGLYPAWIIATFNPGLALKGGSQASGGGTLFRKTLVVVQFTVSACLLMAVILMAQQVDYLRGKNLGFNKDQVVLVEVNNAVRTAAALRRELSAIPAVSGVSFSTSTPSSVNHWGTPVSRISRNDPDRKPVTLILADEQYAALYKLTLKSGRFLQYSDTNRISNTLPQGQRVMQAVVNEQLVRELGFESNDAAIGQKIYTAFNEGNAEIVGVVANFHDGPLTTSITPVLITPQPGKYEMAGIRFEQLNDMPMTLEAVALAWKKVYPEGVFTFNFLDQQIDAYYKEEERLFNLFKVFAGVAMVISCLGLFSLAAFTTQRRVKEIGIRKALGATVSAILVLVSADFIKLVLLAIVLATPMAWYGIDQWLAHYAFHMDITAWAFVVAGAVALFVTLGAIGTQAFKSALANPVDSLRSE